MSRLERLIVKTIIAGAFLFGLGGCGGAGTKILLEDIKQQDITHQTENKESAANEDIQEDVFYKNNQEVGEEDVKLDEQKDISFDMYESLHVPNCLEGEIQKVECETNGPCKGYQKKECFGGAWVEKGGCENFKLIYTGVSSISSWENKVAFVKYLDKAQYFVSDLETGTTTGIEGIESSQLIHLKANDGKVLVSDCKKMYIFDLSTEQLQDMDYGAPNIFTEYLEGTECVLGTECIDVNKDKVVCRELTEASCCVTDYDLDTKKKVNVYCSDFFNVDRMALSGNKVFVSLYSVSTVENKARIISLDLGTGEESVLVDEVSDCDYPMLDLLVDQNYLVYSKCSDPGCNFFPVLNAEQELFYLDLSQFSPAQSLTAETGFACGINPSFADLSGKLLTCSTGKKDGYKLKIINLQTKQQALVAEGAYYVSVSGNKLSFEKEGSLYLCELKDEWVK